MKTIIHFAVIKPPYKFTRNWVIHLFIILHFLFPSSTFSQCTTYTVNWDYLDFLHNSATWYNTNSPSTGQPFVTNTMKQTQRFAMGPTNSLTFATSMAVGSSGSFWGDVTSHAGDVTGYTGADILFVPTTGQTITLTFLNEVTNASFTIYDIDRNAVYGVTAVDGSSTAQTITTTTYPQGINPTILTIGGTPTARTITAGNTALTPPDNRGTVTIAVAGPVKTITITASTIGSDASIWFSDISACVPDPGFTSDYYLPYTQPYTNQPGYFLVNPDSNLNVYMVDPVNATAHLIFTDPGTALGAAPAGVAMNSLAYDPVNHWLYYVMNGSSNKPGNRSVKKYDFTTGTISTIINDINSLGIPTFIQGAEAAAAAFYDGSLYLGVEGTDAISFSTNTESIIWRIDFDGSGGVLRASQVFGVPSDNGGQPSHDWGDFIIKNGLLESHASNMISPSYQSQFVHYNLQSGAATTYTGYADTSGQIGQLYNGTVYRIDNRVALYNENGTTGTASTISLTSCSPSWNNKSANDISCPFKPMQDFGDAPSSYDPIALSVAANQKACNNSTLRIGSAWGDEWSKNTSADASGDDEEDGIGTVTIMNSDGAPYNHVQDVTVLNNTGATAYLAGWLDYDADGLFEASEGVVITVPSSPTPQIISLGWIGITVAEGTPNSFLRVRLYSGSLTANDATGWFADGETEDYPVISQAIPLTIQLLDFNAMLTEDKKVLLKWKASTDDKALGFEIERSKDQNTWEKIGWVNIKSSAFTTDYSFLDREPFQGRSYYRLKMVEKEGISKYSATKIIQLDYPVKNLKVYPNPAKNIVIVTFISTGSQTANLQLRSLSGQVIIKKSTLLNQGENRIPIETMSISNGLYILELITPEKTYVNKLAVTH